MTTSPDRGVSPERGSDWRERAACRGEDPEMWFPESPRGRDAKKVETKRARDAKTICGGCDARADCLAWAFTTGQKYGIWGGLDERERDRIRDREYRKRKKEATR